LEALLSSTLAVAIAEIGDKTQLLSLFLVSRFTRPNDRWAIVAGVAVATLANHALSAWLGAWAAATIPAEWLRWLLAGSFFAIGLWLLIPDTEDEESTAILRYGAFVATTALFFLAEIGDKTQIATVVLAAKFSATSMVILGTTLGMLLANVPVIWAGAWLMQRLPLNWARWGACLLFITFGVATVVAG
jgi:putative Ca2+/H+ antiporter (TMEM165/GDT1 family)